MKIFKSFKYAIKGIIYTLKNERNMRFHTFASVCVLVLSPFFNLSLEKYIILFLTITLVVAFEMINSSVESLVDVCSKDYNSTAKAAKDIAAGAVLITSLLALVIGIMMFHDVKCYIKLWEFLYVNPFSFVVLSIFAVFGYLYIFWGPTEIKNRTKKFKNNIKAKK